MSKPRVNPSERWMGGNPPELVVYDELQACPYLPGQTARMPLRVPARWLEPEELDARLEAGDRRQGIFLYRTNCPACNACQPIRIDVSRFMPSRSQRRVLKVGNARLRLEIARPIVDEHRVELFNRHKRGRGLAVLGEPTDLTSYREFLVLSCCETWELRYFLEERLIGIALADRGKASLSAVYCYYDPDYAPLSLGAYSILKQIELCQGWGLRHLYLGLYIAECERMRYKSGYLPHERLIEGRWLPFEHPTRRR